MSFPRGKTGSVLPGCYEEGRDLLFWVQWVFGCEYLIDCEDFSPLRLRRSSGDGCSPYFPPALFLFSILRSGLKRKSVIFA